MLAVRRCLNVKVNAGYVKRDSLLPWSVNSEPQRRARSWDATHMVFENNRCRARSTGQNLAEDRALGDLV